MAVHILASSAVEIFDLQPDAVPTGIELETTAPVDDILVSTSAGGFCFVNVKKTVTYSAKPESPLGSVLDQFVRLWIACRDGRSSNTWQRPLNQRHDRLLLIASPDRSRSFTTTCSRILTRIADRNCLEPVDAIATTQTERRVYDAVLELLRSASTRHAGEPFPDDEMASLLGTLRVVLLDPEGTEKTNCLALLRNNVIETPSDAERSWLRLVADCQHLAERRSGADRAALRASLAAHGIGLAGLSDMAADIRRLRRATQTELASLQHLAYLNVPTLTGTERVAINRRVTEVLADHAPRTSLLVIGEPGSGKSGAIYSAATQLISEGHPVVVIAADRHPLPSLDALGRDLELEHDLIDVLRSWGGNRRGVLFIDALDATRGGPSDRLFQELIRQVNSQAPNWRIIASIRVFDLKFGVHYRNLFAGSPVDDSYANSEFDQIQHLSIPRLTDDELSQVWTRSSLMNDAYCNGTDGLQELLRSPFNLFLLANVLSAGSHRLREISTQLELLHLYWSHRVTGRDQQVFAREGFLRTALNRMLEHHQLQILLGDLPHTQSADLDRLLSEGVLSPVEGSRDQISRISFSHHVLFDYSIARLIFESGKAPDLAARLAKSDDDALLMAPGAIMAFQILWEEGHTDRSEFWAKSLELARAEGSGAFCRMLPARTAASLAGSLEDIQPVLDCLNKPDDTDRQAALFLVRHCIGALTAGVVPRRLPSSPRGPWPRIAQELANVAVEPASWILKPTIAEWVESPSALTADEKRYINSAARAMLNYGAHQEYEVSIVTAAIRGVARTFESAPEDSLESLTCLLSPEHVAEYGHKELFWLAQEFKYLLQHIPATSRFIGDVYRAGYCTPLPSDSELTNLSGSRILGLISNKRQDFEGVRYQLSEAFSSYFNAAPESATAALVDVVHCGHQVDDGTDESLAEFLVGGERAQYQPDYSGLRSLAPDNYKLPPLHQFESALVALVDTGRTDAIDRVLGVVVRRNLMAAVWAAVIRAAKLRPEVLGSRILDVVTAKPVLEGRDTRKAAGDLIEVVHPLLDALDRGALEGAVLATNSRTQRVLLGCFQTKNMMSPEARARRLELENHDGLIANRNPIEISSGWASDEDWWFREEGVDLKNEENAALRTTISIVEGIKPPDGATETRRAYLEKHWPQVQALRATLDSTPNVPDALLMSGWHAIAAAAGTATDTAKTDDDLARFAELEEIIRRALRSDLWPVAERNPEREAGFARMPSWGTPSPRVEAAGALMALDRAMAKPDPARSNLIRSLARDPSPAVRHQILGRVNMLFESNKPLMLELCDIGFSDERNEGVLSFFLPATNAVLADRPAWFSDRVLALDNRLEQEDPPEDVRDEYRRHLVHLLLRLWLVFDQQSAGARARGLDCRSHISPCTCDRRTHCLA